MVTERHASQANAGALPPGSGSIERRSALHVTSASRRIAAPASPTAPAGPRIDPTGPVSPAPTVAPRARRPDAVSVKVHHLNCGTMRPPLTPELVCHVLLVETPTGLVLVDSGFGLEDVRDPAGRLGLVPSPGQAGARPRRDRAAPGRGPRVLPARRERDRADALRLRPRGRPGGLPRARSCTSPPTSSAPPSRPGPASSAPLPHRAAGARADDHRALPRRRRRVVGLHRRGARGHRPRHRADRPARPHPRPRGGRRRRRRPLGPPRR